MDTKEINQENVKTLVKLGIDTNDIADIYLSITKKGADISKDTYINNLTEKFKFFQTRNNNINDEEDKAILKEDVLNMIKKNKDLVIMDIDKKIKPLCEKLDSYYFMNAGFTNNIIKNNPKIFNIRNIDLEIYSTILSDFGIKIDGEIVNLFEYVIKQKNNLLLNDVKVIFRRLMYIKNSKNSKLLTKEEVEVIMQAIFCVSDESLKGQYEIPEYNGEDLLSYKKKILDQMN